MLSENRAENNQSRYDNKKVDCLFLTISINNDGVSLCLPVFIKFKNENPELNFLRFVLYLYFITCFHEYHTV